MYAFIQFWLSVIAHRRAIGVATGAVLLCSGVDTLSMAVLAQQLAVTAHQGEILVADGSVPGRAPQWEGRRPAKFRLEAAEDHQNLVPDPIPNPARIGSPT